LTLECIRHVAIRDKADKVVLLPLPTRVAVDVELGDADPAQVLPKLREALFHSSIDDALAARPKDRKGSIPAQTDFNSAQRPDPSKPACDCAVDDRDACSDQHRKIEGIVPPKFLGGRDPQLTDKARKSGLDTKVDVALKVDEAGRHAGYLGAEAVRNGA
jgi:hypothetical protein